MGRALRHRNYRLFFSGQGISLIGTWLTRVATAWLVYRLTGSALLLGIVGFAGQIPTFLLAPFAGVLVDRWNRHRVLVVTQALAMVQSALLAWFALRGTITVWHVLCALRLPGAHQRLRHAGPAGVRRRDGRRARGSGQRHRAQLVDGQRRAPARPVAGGRAHRAGRRGLVLRHRRRQLPRGDRLAAGHAAASAARRRRASGKHVLVELREGFRYAASFAPIRAILLLLALVSFIGVPYTVLMPIFASEVLHGGPHTLGPPHGRDRRRRRRRRALARRRARRCSASAARCRSPARCSARR